MKNNSSLYNLVKKISKEVRFGNLLSRISSKAFTEDKEFINDFNNMLDAISDREKMIKELTLDETREIYEKYMIKDY